MHKGKLTISIDLELAWGWWDVLTPQILELAHQSERAICSALLNCFDQFGVPATWAIVAALLDEPSSRSRPGPQAAGMHLTSLKPSALPRSPTRLAAMEADTFISTVCQRRQPWRTSNSPNVSIELTSSGSSRWYFRAIKSNTCSVCPAWVCGSSAAPMPASCNAPPERALAGWLRRPTSSCQPHRPQ